MRKCKICEKDFTPYDEYDDICFSCARNSETELNICYKCKEWFLDSTTKIYCKECEEKLNAKDTSDKTRNAEKDS